MDVYSQVSAAADSVLQRIDYKPEIAIILGSGLNDFADSVDIEAEVSYADIAGFPVSTVRGHSGKFIFGRLCGRRVVLMKGRVHYYEGYQMNQVVLPVRTMGMLGAKKLILTNAAGGVNPSFSPGELMLITDHIMNLVPSPLIGENDDRLGRRFPDCTAIYDRELSDCIREAAAYAQIELREGVYIQLTGPNFETPMEVRMCRFLGGDAVGMSTACEAVAAHHMGIRVCGVSCITNMGSGMCNALSHDEVFETAYRAKESFTTLIKSAVARMDD